MNKRGRGKPAPTKRSGNFGVPLDTPWRKYQCQKDDTHPVVTTNVATPRCSKCRTSRMEDVGPADVAATVTANLRAGDVPRIQLPSVAERPAGASAPPGTTDEVLPIDAIIEEAGKRGLTKKLDELSERIPEVTDE